MICKWSNRFSAAAIIGLALLAVADHQAKESDILTQVIYAGCRAHVASKVASFFGVR